MGILGFGRARRLEDLKIKDLRREKLTEEVRQDQTVVRMRRAQDEYDGLLAAARNMSSNGTISDTEVDIAAYKMSVCERRTQTAEAALQRTITRMGVLDLTIEVLEEKEQLQRDGIWKTLNEMKEDDLEDQLEAIAIARKESDLTWEQIQGMLGKDPLAVDTKRGPGQRRAKEAILAP